MLLEPTVIRYSMVLLLPRPKVSMGTSILELLRTSFTARRLRVRGLLVLLLSALRARLELLARLVPQVLQVPREQLVLLALPVV